jgi:WD40 repeat protein
VWGNRWEEDVFDGECRSDDHPLGRRRQADSQVQGWVKSRELTPLLETLTLLVSYATDSTDVVRSLVLLPNGEFASTSNDGTIRVWSFDGELRAVLVGHKSFVYSVCVLPNGDLASAGEDHCVRIWSSTSIELCDVTVFVCKGLTGRHRLPGLRRRQADPDDSGQSSVPGHFVNSHKLTSS